MDFPALSALLLLLCSQDRCCCHQSRSDQLPPSDPWLPGGARGLNPCLVPAAGGCVRDPGRLRTPATTTSGSLWSRASKLLPQDTAQPVTLATTVGSSQLQRIATRQICSKATTFAPDEFRLMARALKPAQHPAGGRPAGQALGSGWEGVSGPHVKPVADR